MHRLTLLIAAVLLSWTAAMAQYPELKPFKEKEQGQQLTPTQKKELWGYTNREEKFLIKPVFQEARPFQDGLAEVRVGGLWGLIDATPRYVAKPIYDEIQRYSDRFLLVRENGKWGTLSYTGEVKAAPVYDVVEKNAFFPDLYLCRKNGLIGALAADGSLQTPTLYTECRTDQGPLAIVRNEVGHYGLVSSNFREVQLCEYDQITPLTTSPYRYEVVRRGQHGVVGSEGKIIVNRVYESVQAGNGGEYYIVQQDGLYGFMKGNGDIITNCEFKEIHPLSAQKSAFVEGHSIYVGNYDEMTGYETSYDFDSSSLRNLALYAGTQLRDVNYEGGHVLLKLADGQPAWVSYDNQIVWTANNDVKRMLEGPIGGTFDTERVVSERHFRTTTSDGTCYGTRSCNLSIPTASSDFRVNVESVRSWIAGLCTEDHASSIEGLRNWMATQGPDSDFKWTGISNIPGGVSSINTMEASTEGDVQCVDNGILFYRTLTYWYGGGAHGMGATSYDAYDLASNRPLQTSDFFSAAEREKVLQLLRSNVARYKSSNYDYDDNDELREGLEDYSDFPQFYIQNGTAHFIFAPYDIACYAAGQPEFEVPLSDIK